MQTHLNSLTYPVAEKSGAAENTLEVRIERSWFNARHVVLFIFALVWNGIWLHFYTNLFLDTAPFFVYILLVLHATAGIWMMYAAICGFVNKTIVTANTCQITIRHSPLPWAGQRTINLRDISQLYVAQQINSHKGLTYITYDLELITKSDKVLPIFKGLDSLAEARDIEKKLEALRA